MKIAMPIKLLKILLLLAFAVLSDACFADDYQRTDCKGAHRDSTFRKIKLSNGLTIIIEKTKKLNGSIQAELVLKAGRRHETRKQLEYSHLIEHLAFEGTEHFPGDSIRKFIANHGLQMGVNANASTADDYVSYDFSLPDDDPKLFTGILYFLADCATEIKWSSACVQGQAGAIISELGGDPSNYARSELRFVGEKVLGSARMSLRDRKKRFESLNSVNNRQLRQYYEKYYKPENMAIIVVGDLDLKATGDKLVAIFSNIRGGGSKRNVLREVESLSPTGRGRFSLYVDPTVYAPRFDIIFFRNMKSRTLNNAIDHRSRLIDRICATLVNRRLQAVGEGLSANLSFNMYGAGVDALQITTTITDGEQISRDVYPTVFEIERMKKHGFLSEEFDDALNLLSKEERSAAGTDFFSGGNKWRDHFLYGSMVLSPDESLALTDSLISTIQLGEVNSCLNAWLDVNNIGIASYLTSMPSAVVPGDRKVIAWMDSTRLNSLPPFELPKTIRDSLHNSVVRRLAQHSELAVDTSWHLPNSKLFAFDNGARVIVQENSEDIVAFSDEITVLCVNLSGGTIPFPGRINLTDFLIDDLTGVRVLPFSRAALAQFLNQEGIAIDVSNYDGTNRIEGKFEESKLETSLALITSYFFLPEFDASADQGSVRAYLRALSSAVKETLPCDFSPIEKSWASDDQLRAVHDNVLGGVGDFVFIITGVKRHKEAKTFLAHYIGGLPKSRSKKVCPATAGLADNGSFDLALPSSMDTTRVSVQIRIAGPNSAPSDLHGRVLRALVSNVFQELFFERLRTQEGATYIPLFSVKERRLDSERLTYMYVASFDCIKARKRHLIDVSKQILVDVGRSGVPIFMFKRAGIKTVNDFNKRYAESFNAFELLDFFRFGYDASDTGKIEEIVGNISANDIKVYVSEMFKESNFTVYDSDGNPKSY